MGRCGHRPLRTQRRNTIGYRILCVPLRFSYLRKSENPFFSVPTMTMWSAISRTMTKYGNTSKTIHRNGSCKNIAFCRGTMPTSLQLSIKIRKWTDNRPHPFTKWYEKGCGLFSIRWPPSAAVCCFSVAVQKKNCQAASQICLHFLPHIAEENKGSPPSSRRRQRSSALHLIFRVPSFHA